MRKDVIRNRGQILEAARRLLEARGMTFSLPELAREAGVGTATVYRHFHDVDDVLGELVQRLLAELTSRLESLEEGFSGRELFERVCAEWVDSAITWAGWAARFRSGEGFLVRSLDEANNEYTHRRFLERVLHSVAEGDGIALGDPAYLVVVWVALFDERVMHDLRVHGLTRDGIVDRLTAAMAAVLRLESK